MLVAGKALWPASFVRFQVAWTSLPFLSRLEYSSLCQALSDWHAAAVVLIDPNQLLSDDGSNVGRTRTERNGRLARSMENGHGSSLSIHQ